MKDFTVGLSYRGGNGRTEKLCLGYKWFASIAILAEPPNIDIVC